MQTDFDDEPTHRIPRETMRQLVYGEGHLPVGPDRPTRDLHPIKLVEDEISDGVPMMIGIEDTEPAVFV